MVVGKLEQSNLDWMTNFIIEVYCEHNSARIHAHKGIETEENEVHARKFSWVFDVGFPLGIASRSLCVLLTDEITGRYLIVDGY